jgi:K+/H+ antiporter YhaU regulatory subunit KhtT
MELHWIDLSQASAIVGKSIQELQIRQQTGASIVGILRDSEIIPNPGAESVLQLGDVIAVLGDREQVDAVRDLVESGPGIASDTGSQPA